MASLPKNILSFEEPFGDTNSRKTELKEVSEGYRKLLEEKMTDLKDDAARVGKQALVIGGAIAAVYLVLELLLPDDEPEVKTKQQAAFALPERTNNQPSWLVKTATSLAMTWALDIARQKLMDFLATQQQTNEVKNTNDTPG